LSRPCCSRFRTPFGIQQFGALAAPATIARGQLLRPYPQFGNVLAHRVTAARSRYDALVISAERRQHDGWGARVNYVYSVLKDNQSGEGNSFTNNVQAVIDSFDLEREFGYSLRDTPHRLNISGTLELPFGTGRRWLSTGGVWSGVFGGWAISGVGVYQSGFPVAIIQSSNAASAFGFGQRPNVVAGVDPVLTANPSDSYNPSCACIRWLNPAAWSAAPPFTLGNAPHADRRARTPGRRNWDVALQKSVPLARARLTIRAEVLNALDDPAFFGPRIRFGAQNFGELFRDGGFPRTLQFMARLAW
jgi:trimeric autotransporter adhesin